MVSGNPLSDHRGLQPHSFMIYTPICAGYIHFLCASMTLFCILEFWTVMGACMGPCTPPTVIVTSVLFICPAEIFGLAEIFGPRQKRGRNFWPGQILFSSWHSDGPKFLSRHFGWPKFLSQHFGWPKFLSSHFSYTKFSPYQRGKCTCNSACSLLRRDCSLLFIFCHYFKCERA